MSESKNQQRTLTKRPDPLIFCEILHDDNPIESDDGWVSSPIRCFDQAVDENPEIIVVNFGKTAQSDRKTLLELATALKRNNHTKNCPVLALLHSKHRKLIEELKLAKVDYVRYIGEAKPDSNLVREIIADMGAGDSLDRHLETLCPFLHYIEIDLQNEMTVCGAYLDRMVLGGRRLHELCETDDHLDCEYYQHPRRKS